MSRVDARHQRRNAELMRLRAWKAEAIIVLDEWESAWQAAVSAGVAAPLGRSKAQIIAEHFTATAGAGAQP